MRSGGHSINKYLLNMRKASGGLQWWRRHLQEMKSSRRDKICTQISLSKHRILQDTRKEIYLVWWKSGRIHELNLGEQVRFPQGETEVIWKVQKTVSFFYKTVGRQNWRGTLGLDRPSCKWQTYKPGLDPVGVETHWSPSTGWESWSHQSLHKPSLAMACRMEHKGKKSEVEN